MAIKNVNCKKFAATGLMIPEIGLGTWQYRGGVDPLRRGIELGACFVDTAEAYGTEEIVGEAIRGVRDRVVLATKALPRHFRRGDLLRAADQSLARLKTDYIDLYQLHWPNYTVPLEETMAAMEELVDQGKVRFIGVSNFSVTDLKEAQAVLARHRIVSNQVRYNLIERTVECGLLRYCQEHDITVIAYSPLARALVASRLMWKIERRSSGIPSIASRDRHRLESRRGGYQGIASLAIVALRGSERFRFSRPWPRSARARLDGVTPRAAAAC